MLVRLCNALPLAGQVSHAHFPPTCPSPFSLHITGCIFQKLGVSHNWESNPRPTLSGLEPCTTLPDVEPNHGLSFQMLFRSQSLRGNTMVTLCFKEENTCLEIQGASIRGLQPGKSHFPTRLPFVTASCFICDTRWFPFVTLPFYPFVTLPFFTIGHTPILYHLSHPNFVIHHAPSHPPPQFGGQTTSPLQSG